jgi:hypothetical protein
MSQVTVTITGSVNEVKEAIRGLGFLYGDQVTIQPTLVVPDLKTIEKTIEKATKAKPVAKVETVKADPTDTIQNGGKSEPAPVVVTPAEQATPAAPTAAPATATTKTPRQVTISELISASLKKVPKDKVVELLKSFGVEKAGQLKVGDEERFIGAIRVLMA